MTDTQTPDEPATAGLHVNAAFLREEILEGHVGQQYDEATRSLIAGLDDDVFDHVIRRALDDDVFNNALSHLVEAFVDFAVELRQEGRL